MRLRGTVPQLQSSVQGVAGVVYQMLVSVGCQILSEIPLFYFFFFLTSEKRKI